MRRRKLLISIGALGAGGTAAFGTEAFTSVEAERNVDVDVAGDASAFLSLAATGSANSEDYVDVENDKTLEINLDGENNNIDAGGVNNDAITIIEDLFKILNQGTQPVNIYIEDDSDAVTFQSEASSIEDPSNSIELDVGTEIIIGIKVDTTTQEFLSNTTSESLIDSATIVGNANRSRSSTTEFDLVVDADGGDDVGEFSTLTDALDNAEENDIIGIKGGTYDESVTIDVEGLTLKGPNAGIAGDSNARGAEATVTQGIEVSASGVTLDGLDVTNSDVNGIVIAEAPSNVTVTNTVVRNITGGTAGASKGVGNGINLQFNDVFEQTSTGIGVTNNLITGVATQDASGSSPDADAIGVQLLPRGNDVVDLRIVNNTIEKIQPGAAPGGRSEARAVSIATQFTDTSGGTRGDFGQATGLTVADNDVSNLTADFARAVNLFEDKTGPDSGDDSPVGPENFTIAGNTVSGIDSTGDFFDLALFVGEYDVFGNNHSVQDNTFDGAAIENFGDSDELNASGNTFDQGSGIPGDGNPDSGLYHIGPGNSAVRENNNFDKTPIDTNIDNLGSVVISESAFGQVTE